MMNELQLIQSFVVRCNLLDVSDGTGQKQWRIKVTHVQGEEEITLTSLEEALAYMKRTLGE
ncbi:hypothetical protein LCL95_08020 [Bacillus timonensis]|nr:hypothetical protein [Bacillus timonensis]